MSTKTKIIIFLIAIVCLLLFMIGIVLTKPTPQNIIHLATPWQFRSVDTMKISRDTSKENLNNPAFDAEIETEVNNIAQTGATHVAIATPYDEEFVPFLKRWVASARKHHLKVWFRGNWSSWEGWFGREKKMTFSEHIQKSVEFIKNHPDLFEHGDAFTACPECENGAQGDPRNTGKVEEYRHFLVDEHIQTAQAFAAINRQVNTSLLSMNKDVAELVMDEKTAQGVGGFVTIDHYIKDPKQLAHDVDALAKKTRSKIILGEMGAPIPDLQGDLTEEQQAKWIDTALGELLKSDSLYGLSYWVNKDGSTALWKDDNTPKKVVEVITKYFTPMQLYGTIQNELGFPVKDIIIEANGKQYKAQDGEYLIPLYGLQTVNFKKDGYISKSVQVKQNPGDSRTNIVLINQNPSVFYSFLVKVKKALAP